MGATLRLVHPLPSSLRLVPLTPELLELAAKMQEDSVANLVRSPEAGVRLLQPGYSFAVMDGGALYCAMGVFLIHYGRGAAWMLMTPLAGLREKTFATRRGAELIERWQLDPAYRRIEIHIRADQPWRTTFAAQLGMTEALGPMRAWGPDGADYWQYARIAP